MGTVLLVMILIPLLAAIVVALLGSRRLRWIRQVSLAATVATLTLALVVAVGYRPPPLAAGSTDAPGRTIRPQMELQYTWLAFEFSSRSSARPVPARLQFYLGMDGLSLWLVGLTALLTVSCVLISWETITERTAEYYACLLLLETGLLGVFCAFDVILFYVFFEFTLVPLYFLIGIWGGPQRIHAARKFFIYTLTGSVLSLVGLVALVFAVHSRDPGTLTFAMPELAAAMGEQMRAAAADHDLAAFWHRAQFWIFLALFAGFAIKVPLVPFHTWLPLAHVEAPTAGSVLLAGVLLKLGAYGFLRLCLPLLPYACWNLGAPLVATLSIIGILYGALCSLAQNDVKRLVAYSSVSHLGFCMLGMFSLNAEGISGGTLQMVNHGLSTGALFLLVGMLYDRLHTRQLSELGGLAGRLPVLSSFMVFICLSSLGLPGLNGFIGEVLALMGMFKVHPGYAALGTAGIILGAWYLLSMLQRAFFGPLKLPEHAQSPLGDLTRREIASLAPIAALCLLIGVYPKPFLDAMRPDVEAIAAIYADPGSLEPLPESARSQAEAR